MSMLSVYVRAHCLFLREDEGDEGEGEGDWIRTPLFKPFFNFCFRKKKLSLPAIFSRLTIHRLDIYLLVLLCIY